MNTEVQNTKTDYEVGYGKPPKKSQFKPGQSGNPRGRRKGSKNVRTIIRQELLETVTVRIDGKIRRIPKIEAITKHFFSKALQGNQKAMIQAIELGQQVDIESETEHLTMPTRQEDEALIARFLERHRQGQESSHG